MCDPTRDFAETGVYRCDGGRRGGTDLLRYVLAPLVGFALCLWLWTSLSGTSLKVGLAWLVDNDDPWVQRFIGIVRGRTERSSRG